MAGIFVLETLSVMIQVASFKLTGIRNEWTARLPSALCLLAVALAFMTIGRRALESASGNRCRFVRDPTQNGPGATAGKPVDSYSWRGLMNDDWLDRVVVAKSIAYVENTIVVDPLRWEWLSK